MSTNFWNTLFVMKQSTFIAIWHLSKSWKINNNVRLQMFSLPWCNTFLAFLSIWNFKSRILIEFWGFPVRFGWAGTTMKWSLERKGATNQIYIYFINTSSPQLFKGWITLSTGYITIQWINVNKTNHAIRWIVIYPVDSVIQPLNNPGLQWNTRWAFARKHDIFTREGNMIYYTTQAVRGPITKINQSKCSIARPIFLKYWTGHCPEWSRTCVFAFFSRVINLLLTKLARDRTGRISALGLFCTDVLSKPQADILPVRPSRLVNKIYIFSPWGLPNFSFKGVIT